MLKYKYFNELSICKEDTLKYLYFTIGFVFFFCCCCFFLQQSLEIIFYIIKMAYSKGMRKVNIVKNKLLYFTIKFIQLIVRKKKTV